MNPNISVAPRSSLEMCGNRSSSVILHHVPPDRADEFLEWERGITRVAASFPGYQATDVYPPADPGKREWVVVIHFDRVEDMRRWADSPERAEWTAKLNAEIGSYHMKTLPDGFASWFASMADGPPAPWQMALTVVFALYPTVMLLNIFLGRSLSPLGLAASMLVGNVMSVSILQWLVMPRLERVLRPWLHPDDRNRGRTLAIGGLLIAAMLAGMVIFFRQITG